ncbi:arginine--tRNA ligase [archaeon]|nr:arginine--tRNA ligase [archaeon]
MFFGAGHHYLEKCFKALYIKLLKRNQVIETVEIKKAVAKLLVKAVKLGKNEVIKLLEVPPDPKLGDLSFPCFTLGKNPKKIAEKTASKIKPKGMIKKVKAAGPYINFYFDRSMFADKVVKECLKDKKVKTRNKVISLDMFGPNAMKGVHVGHVRNAAVSGCVCRLLKKSGFKVKTVSFGCDIGLPVAKVLWGYLNLGLKPEGDKGEWLGKLYSVVSNKFKQDERVREEVYELNKKLYNKDKKVMKVYEKLVSWSYSYISSVEKKLRLKIDNYLWETACVKPALKAIERLKKKGVAEESDEALIVNLEEHGLGVFVLLTKQGVPTYEAKDLGLHLVKSEKQKADEYLVFTGAEQKMHFKQVIKTLELMGFKKGSITHIPYEEVMLEGEKISSRKGNVILFNQMIDSLNKAAMKEVSKKNSKVSQKQKKEIADEIALSSLFYGMIKQDMNKKIDFRVKDWVRFDGDTGAYLQYNYVRAKKILEGQQVKKVKIEVKHESEYELIRGLSEFDKVLKQAVDKLDPSLIARHAYRLASSFSRFYEKCPVVMREINNSRLLIVKAFEQKMKELMLLLGFKPLKKM